jgi:hypothetical protein
MDPDPTPDPFCSDYRDAKKIYNLPAGTLSSGLKKKKKNPKILY